MTGNDAPIAVIGIGCRLPGEIEGPSAFWDALCEGRDVVDEVPPSRWDANAYYNPERNRPGAAYTRAAAALNDIDRFDAQFFRISPQEASRMDPHHRLALEVAWEALEDAGLPPSSLAMQRVGVYIGHSNHDHSVIQFRDLKSLNAYTMVGSAVCMSSNRVSYFLDLRGPSATIDTACASALTSIHSACQSIWRGDCRMALAGGVSLALGPGGYIGFSRAQMLSPTGRCHPFSDQADGYVRGEGAGVVVLKPLDAAMADGDRIYAVVRATGINHHGRTSGISNPGVDGQAELLETLVQRAGIAPHEIQYVETHGTGTAAGDPVEAAAIGRVLGSGRPEDAPLLIGSAKSNVGHSESAAGAVGFIKLALALYHGRIPKSLHAETLNPAIPFDDLGLRVARTASEWPVAPSGASSGSARRGLVSAFGFGGSNAAAILEEAPPKEVPPKTMASAHSAEGPWLLPISARSEDALKSLASRYLGHIREERPAPGDLAYSASLTRDHHEHRLGIAYSDVEDLSGLLAAYLRDESSPRILAGRAHTQKPRIAFVFCGNGPQWWGMGRELRGRSTVFQQALERCAAAYGAISDFDLFRELDRDQASTRMHGTDVAQPAIFAIQYALCQTLASWGIEPSMVLGHSVGEAAAAWASGALSLEDAITLTYHRARAQHRTLGSGRMGAAAISLEDAEALVDGSGVYISAQNSARQVTLAGPLDALRAVGRKVEAAGAFWREIPMDYAFHGPAMDMVREDLLQAISGIVPRRNPVPIYSSVTGERIAGETLDASYWWRNVRQPVRFAPAMQAALRDGCEIVIEIGPHPALRAYIAENASTAGTAALALPTLKRGESDLETMFSTAAALYANGAPLDLARIAGEGKRISLPTYPWQRERHWHEPPEHSGLTGPEVHPLLGRRVPSRDPEWRQSLDLAIQPWVKDHRVGGVAVYPGAGYVEQALAALREVSGPGPAALQNLRIEAPFVVPEQAAAPVSISLDAEVGKLEVRGGDNGETLHFRAEVHRDPPDSPPALDLEAIRRRCKVPLDVKGFHRAIARRGVVYGPAFCGMKEAWLGDDESVATVELPAELASGFAGKVYRLHPALLDACLQTSAAIPGVLREGRELAMPVSVERIAVWSDAPARVVVHARRRSQGRSALGFLQLADERGNVFASIDGLLCAFVDVLADGAEHLPHEIVWIPQPLGPEPAPTMGSARELAARASERVNQVAKGVAEPGNLGESRNTLCTLLVARALMKLGWQPMPGETFVLPELAARLGVIHKHQRQLAQLLGFLAEDGVFERLAGGEWKVTGPLPAEDPHAAFLSVWHELPLCHAELEMLYRVGTSAAEILRGEIEALPLIFADGARAQEEVYDSSPVMRCANAAVGAALRDIAEQRPADSRLDVLELGAGTGGLTAWLLPELDAVRDRYRFTDVSDGFMPSARSRFADYPFVQYGLLDIEAPPEGYEPADVIVASNVLHATRDLQQTLKNVHGLLKPGGAAIFAEARPSRASHLIYGFLPGWWLVTDTELRASGPLIDADAWAVVTREAGFEDAAPMLPDFPGAHPTAVVARKARTAAAHPADSGSASGLWIVLADRSGCGAALAEGLERAGGVVQVVPNRSGIAPAVASASASGLPLRGVIQLWGLDAAGDPAESLENIEDDACLGTVEVLRALGTHSWRAVPRLWIVTRGARAVLPDDSPAFVQTTLWGFGRAIMLEDPSLRCTMVDLDPRQSGAEALVRELLAASSSGSRPAADAPAESSVAFRGEARLVERLRALTAPDAPAPLAAATSFELRTSRPGQLSKLDLVEAPRREPGFGEVELQISHASLNLRDLLLAMGMLPIPGEFGAEGSGRIVRLGPGVADFAVGDEVLTRGPGTFSRFATVPAEYILRKPAGMLHSAAATIPVAYATAIHALQVLGRMQRGDRLLIHGAAGGLGLAGVYLAQAAGVEIFATAGTPEKRELLRNLGVPHVLDSRGLGFASEIMRITGGEGVDLVLNSLAGDAMLKSLSVLGPFGRFLEVGKRHFEGGQVAWRLLEKRSYHAVDLDGETPAAQRIWKRLFGRIESGLASGEVRPLPHRVFPVDRAAEAFRTMQRSRHVGKLVLDFEDPGVRVRRLSPSMRIRRDGTYLITGGLGGIGLAFAQWLAEQGAGRIALVGRHEPGPEQRAAISDAEREGARVTVHSADAADSGQLAAVLDAIRREGPPLRGIVHAAMVLEDGIAPSLTAERLRKNMRPKAWAGWNLHRQTMSDPLDFFLCCSSISGVMGNAGQAAYGAGNTFLDGLCLYRRSQGLPGLSVSLGYIEDAGWVARAGGLMERPAELGIRGFPVRAALEAIRRLLPGARGHVVLVRADWSRYVASTDSQLAADLPTNAEDSPASPEEPGDLRQQLHSGNAGELLTKRVRWHLNRILGLSGREVDPHASLVDLGLDSLMAIDLVQYIERETGVRIPVMSILQGWSLAILVEALLGQTLPAAKQDTVAAAQR
jgi:acyl transferase domain-containing protein/NADPH:quinone reductase-like Zn-dependent oxidoreductase/acyl carrier protein